jgi:hypothetical protein
MEVAACSLSPLLLQALWHNVVLSIPSSAPSDPSPDVIDLALGLASFTPGTVPTSARMPWRWVLQRWWWKASSKLYCSCSTFLFSWSPGRSEGRDGTRERTERTWMSTSSKRARKAPSACALSLSLSLSPPPPRPPPSLFFDLKIVSSGTLSWVSCLQGNLGINEKDGNF